MTAQSETSVALLRILLEDRFSLKPDYVGGGPVNPDDDACLLIGDQALEENERRRFAFGYDLGTPKVKAQVGIKNCPRELIPAALSLKKNMTYDYWFIRMTFTAC